MTVPAFPSLVTTFAREACVHHTRALDGPCVPAHSTPRLLAPKFCCCSLCCVRASLQSPCRVLWSCVLHSTSSVIVSRVLWKLCYTPQALSLFPKSWDSVLCLPLCLCPFLLVYCPPVYIYCSGLGTFPSVSFPPLQVSSFAVLPLILVSFPPLQSPWCSVTQGPFESRF